MKKSLVALAALALASVASAQSSVTLFGTVDAAITNVSTKTNAVSPALYTLVNGQLALNPAALAGSYNAFGRKQSQSFLANSGMNSSKIGFRGVEDLGGGMAAGFWLEAGLGNDAGNGGGKSGAFNFNRRSTVSLSGPFGEVRLGRDYTPTFWNDTVFDPFGTNGVGTSLISGVNGKLATVRGPGSRNNGAASAQSGSDNYVRTNNSVGYFLPPNLGGFYGQVQYALHENVKNSSGYIADGAFVQQDQSTAGRSVGGRFGYANGPLDVAVSYGQSTATDDSGSVTVFPVTASASEKRKLQTWNLGASYDFGPAKLFGEIAQTRDKYSESASITNALVPAAIDFGAGSFSATDKYTGYLIGVTVPVGAGLIKASYSHVKYKNGDQPVLVGLDSLFLNTNSSNASANKLALGYVHNLSKRTALYTTVSRTSIKNGENNGILAVGSGGGEAAGYALGGAPKSNTAYSFGISHSF